MKSLRDAIDERFYLLRQMTPYIGIAGSLALRVSDDWNLVARRVRGLARIRNIQVWPKGYETSVAVRPDSSDFEVFRQIFVRQQYKPATLIEDVEVIIDCGANAGYSALFFLKHFPHARVIALEPDPLNADLCRHNLRDYGDRVLILQKALWGSMGRLAFVEGTQKPGCEWAIEVEAGTLNAVVDAIDIPNLMAMTGVKRIDLLKIDIEKSEIDVFTNNPSAWLHLVRNIAIELHGETCYEAFHAALSNYHFLESQYGEVTLCTGMHPRLTGREIL
jgi:FkbM family methyltransferase